MSEDAPWSIAKQSPNHLVPAERSGHGSGFNSEPDLLCATVPAEAYYARVQDTQDVQLVEQSADSPLGERFDGAGAAEFSIYLVHVACNRAFFPGILQLHDGD